MIPPEKKARPGGQRPGAGSPAARPALWDADPRARHEPLSFTTGSIIVARLLRPVGPRGGPGRRACPIGPARPFARAKRPSARWRCAAARAPSPGSESSDDAAAAAVAGHGAAGGGGRGAARPTPPMSRVQCAQVTAVLPLRCRHLGVVSDHATGPGRRARSRLGCVHSTVSARVDGHGPATLWRSAASVTVKAHVIANWRVFELAYARACLGTGSWTLPRRISPLLLSLL